VSGLLPGVYARRHSYLTVVAAADLWLLDKRRCTETRQLQIEVSIALAKWIDNRATVRARVAVG
jgi:hypothetical protein